MVEIILTIHTPEGPQSINAQVKDEDEAIAFLRGQRVVVLAEKAARALTPSEEKPRGKSQ